MPTRSVIDPATGEVVAEVPELAPADLDAVLARARERAGQG